MKKLVYIAALVLGFAVKGFADERLAAVDAKVETEASYFAQNNFARRFSEAKNVSWTVTANFQKASFYHAGKKVSAFFDLNGDYIATTQYVEYAKLPALTKARLKKLYAGYEVKDVVKYDLDAQPSQLDIINGVKSYDSLYFANLKNNKESIVVTIAPDGVISYMKTL